MNILVVRVSAIGDVIHTIPAILLLKKINADVKIGWVVQEKAASLLVNQPFVDQLFMLPDNFLRWGNFNKTKKIIESLRQTRWDAIIDFQGLEKTSLLFASLSGRKYGFSAEHARSRFSTIFTQHHTTPLYENIIQKNLDLASLVATDLFGSRICPLIKELNGSQVLTTSSQDKKLVDTWIQENNLKRFVLLAPNTTWDSKHWPIEHWLELIKKLNSVSEVAIVLVGSNFNGMAQQLSTLVKQEHLSVHLLPTFNLLAMAYLMQKTEVIIAPDTGLLHLADLLGVKSIGLFGPTNAKRHGPFLLQENREHVIQILCDHYYQKTHGEAGDCMYQLTPDKLYESVMRIVSAQK